MAKVELLSVLEYPLANAFYKACGDKSKAKRGEYVWVLKQQGAIVAALRLLPKPKGWFCLRSLCVAPAYRRQGVALQLLTAVVKQQSATAIYCFSLAHLPPLYSRAGFRSADEPPPSFMQDEQRRYHQQGKDWVLMTCAAQPMANNG